MKVFASTISVFKKFIIANFIVFGSIFGIKNKERDDPVKNEIGTNK